MGQSRGAEHSDIPPRPLPGVDPFETLQFGEERIGGLRRSTRPRAVNTRLNGYETVHTGNNLETAEASESSNNMERPGSTSRSNSETAGSNDQENLGNSGNILESDRRVTFLAREDRISAPGRQQTLQASENEESPPHALDNEDTVDFSDDEDRALSVEDVNDRARRDYEAENAENLRPVKTPRFKIKDIVPGADESTHLEIVIREFEDQLVTHQIKIKRVNLMEVARSLRRRYPNCFPGNMGEERKSVKSISRICGHTLSRAVEKYKAKEAIMNRTGNSGPPETDLERSLRTIISIDHGASDINRGDAPRHRGRPSRPVILDPPPISRNDDRNRSPLTDHERAESNSALHLDRPVGDNTYRQERVRMARDGAEIREMSLAEMHTRGRTAPILRASGEAAILGATSTVQALSSQKSNVEVLVLHNMQVREEERAKDREERRTKAAFEKEERERKEKIEQDERERKEIREERRMLCEREEKERMNMILFKLIGQGHDSKTSKKQIKVVALPEDSESQPLPTKLTLSSLVALKKDLCDYMSEAVIDGIVLQEASGEQVILTDITQIEVTDTTSFVITKIVRRGKSYFKLNGK
eukprot:GFUD01032042.1.p1 GENE.GFUD01032042.1~~GFUD01032042.1.p1  ORF type:complete len:673 (+),score=157.51 GFUD01032042.1:250-2019(+)